MRWACGHINPQGNKYCAICGSSIKVASNQTFQPQQTAVSGNPHVAQSATTQPQTNPSFNQGSIPSHVIQPKPIPWKQILTAAISSVFIIAISSVIIAYLLTHTNPSPSTYKSTYTSQPTGTYTTPSTPAPLPVPKDPQINKVTPSGDGKDLQIIVTGKGFGSSPVQLPFQGNTRYFAFFNATRNWSAGYNGGPNITAILLNYTEWNNNTVKINGFVGEYGNNRWINVKGDLVGISFKNCQGQVSQLDWTWTYGNSP